MVTQNMLTWERKNVLQYKICELPSTICTMVNSKMAFYVVVAAHQFHVVDEAVAMLPGLLGVAGQGSRLYVLRQGRTNQYNQYNKTVFTLPLKIRESAILFSSAVIPNFCEIDRIRHSRKNTNLDPTLNKNPKSDMKYGIQIRPINNS